MNKKIKSEKERLRYMKMLEDGYSINYSHIHYGINRYLLKSSWTKYKDKWLYLSPILDMFNGEIVSFEISYSPDLKMVLSMLDKAFRKRKNLDSLVLHSDQGW